MNAKSIVRIGYDWVLACGGRHWFWWEIEHNWNYWKQFCDAFDRTEKAA